MADSLPTPSEARARILSSVEPLREAAPYPLDAALGGVLARDVVAALAVPPADNASMDGVALRLAELVKSDGSLPLEGLSAAGDRPAALAPGCARLIYTGAVVPSGADAVVPLEDYDAVGERIIVREPGRVRLGANIRRRGEDLQPGDLVLRAGARLRPQDVGLCASLGLAELWLLRPLRVALLTTGNELTEPGGAAPEGALFDSNSSMLSGLVRSLGAEVVFRQRVLDDPLATERALAEGAAAADLVITTGGVSVGGADAVRPAVARLGELKLWRVALKPGKPLAYGRLAGAHWLGLPGNPTSALVTFLLFAAPLIRALQGRAETFPTPRRVPAGFERDGTQRREEYLRASLREGRALLHPQQGSGVLSAAVWSDALVRVPAANAVREGDLLDGWTYPELLW